MLYISIAPLATIACQQEQTADSSCMPQTNTHPHTHMHIDMYTNNMPLRLDTELEYGNCLHYCCLHTVTVLLQQHALPQRVHIYMQLACSDVVACCALQPTLSKRTDELACRMSMAAFGWFTTIAVGPFAFCRLSAAAAPAVERICVLPLGGQALMHQMTLRSQYCPLKSTKSRVKSKLPENAHTYMHISTCLYAARLNNWQKKHFVTQFFSAKTTAGQASPTSYRLNFQVISPFCDPFLLGIVYRDCTLASSCCIYFVALAC